MISIFGTSNLTTEKNLLPSLRQLSFINSALAEMLDPIIVTPNKGTPDVRTCTVYSDSYTIGGSIGTGSSINGGYTQTRSVGTMTICPNNNTNPCDYVGCHE